eukprot:TRINITY_DN70602_c0_g1_i1.p1 TRINITY_DN70602_c0_g1~~TRINITY_DN70602_c0_g1_i1.p1  ORF type:complete len:313 (+),score=80.58 TRINITY_DN70602_c0_g1_i1:85-939(+)
MRHPGARLLAAAGCPLPQLGGGWPVHKGSGGLSVFIRDSVSGETKEVELSITATVGDLRAAVSGDDKAVQLLWQGAELPQDDAPLADCGIGPEAVVEYNISQRLRWAHVDSALFVTGEAEDTVGDFNPAEPHARKVTGSAAAQIGWASGRHTWTLYMVEESGGDRCYDFGVCSHERVAGVADGSLDSCPYHTGSGIWCVRAWQGYINAGGFKDSVAVERVGPGGWPSSFKDLPIRFELDCEAHTLKVTPEGHQSRLIEGLPPGTVFYPIVGFQSSGAAARIETT